MPPVASELLHLYLPHAWHSPALSDEREAFAEPGLQFPWRTAPQLKLVQPVELDGRLTHYLVPLFSWQPAEPFGHNFARAWKSRRRVRIVRRPHDVVGSIAV
jgi:hypothetical protein